MSVALSAFMLKRAPFAFFCLTAAAACGDIDDEETGGYSESADAGGGHGGPVSPPPPSGGGHGATPGGAQDIGYARDLIAEGGVPEAEAITVEGLLSEHDLPVGGPACDDLFCLRPALARAPVLETGDMAYWIHLGLASGLTDFERPPLDLVVAIDKSSSMSVDMEETNEAVTRLIDELGPDDRLGVLAFDSQVHSIHRFGPVDDPEAVKSAVRGIEASGSFDINTGTRAAYESLEAAGEDPERLRRVIVLSCGYPALSTERIDPYSEMVLAAGAERIGLSFFGVLLGYSRPLSDLLAEARGGSYGYLESLDKIGQVFDEDFDFMMTPLAYDLSFRMEISEGYELVDLVGVPGDDGEARAKFDVSTVFLSKRAGAMAARLRPGDEERKNLGKLSLSYLPEPALGGDGPEEQSATVTRPAGIGGDEPYFESDGVRKMVALVNMAEQMIAALDTYDGGDVDEALRILEELGDYLRAEAEVLEDEALAADVELVDALSSNMHDAR